MQIASIEIFIRKCYVCLSVRERWTSTFTNFIWEMLVEKVFYYKHDPLKIADKAS